MTTYFISSVIVVRRISYNEKKHFHSNFIKLEQISSLPNFQCSAYSFKLKPAVCLLNFYSPQLATKFGFIYANAYSRSHIIPYVNIHICTHSHVLVCIKRPTDIPLLEKKLLLTYFLKGSTVAKSKINTFSSLHGTNHTHVHMHALIFHIHSRLG